MRSFALDHLCNTSLSDRLDHQVAQEATDAADQLATIGEFDARRLYAPAGFPSMFAYCVGRLHLSEDVAYKRIRVARMARRVPAVFTALAENRLHLSGAVLLAPCLTAGNADELLGAVTHRSKTEIETYLAERFPKSEALSWVEDLELGSSSVSDADAGAGAGQAVLTARGELAPGPVGTSGNGARRNTGPVSQASPAPLLGSTAAQPPRARLTPVAAGRFALQVSISQATRDKLEYVKALLAHRRPAAGLPEVFDLALDALIAVLEKRKFAATDRPQRTPRPATNARTIPAHVRRAVWKRDGGRCTFVSEDGRRCPARALLEFDHVTPVARGGMATIEGIRLRCRAHNQYEAARAFGAGFIEAKRAASRGAAAIDPDVVACLRRLGYRAGESRRAAVFGSRAGGSLEARVRLALSWFEPRGRREAAVAGARGDHPPAAGEAAPHAARPAMAT